MTAEQKQVFHDALLLFAAGLLVRLLYAIPGLCQPELLMRPDSLSYLAPAHSLAEHFTYAVNGVPTGLRVPFYPFLCAMIFSCGGGLRTLIVFNCILSSTAIPAICLSAHALSVKRLYAVLAAVFFMLMPTAVAFAPMFLSDALFSAVCAWELFFLTQYLRKNDLRSILWAAVFGGIGTLTRPLNLLWIVPCAAAVIFAEKGKRFRHAVCALLMFCCIVFPWILRNHLQGFGWRIDTVSADSLRHNASVVESRVAMRPAESLRQEYDAHFAKVFSDDPEKFCTESAKLDYQEKYLSEKIKAHPLIYFRGFFHPVLFVPDLPTFLENLGLTKGGRGTWDVIVKDGLFAGVRHYFNGACWAVFPVIFLSLLTFAVYVLAAAELVQSIRKKQWSMLYLFCACFLYYIAVVGTVTYPRFLLPALPMLSLAAGCFFDRKYEKK